MKEMIDILNKNNFTVVNFEDKNDLYKYLESEVDTSKKVAFGGSMTAKELNLYDFFKKRGNSVNWHWKGDDIKESDKADVYFVSPNAITKDGKAFFVDQLGNRIRNISSDTKEIIIVTGTNKIVENEKEAIKRIETIAAPKNAKRLKLSTPCVKTGICSHCMSKERICNYFLKIERNIHNNMSILIINGEYGY